MDRIEFMSGTADLARAGNRFRNRPPELDPELAVSNAPPSPDAKPGLGGYVPSALISTEQRLFALMVGGAPAWSRRLKRIEALTDQALEQLATEWSSLAEELRRDPSAFPSAWRAHATAFDFRQVNELIRRHNEHFPAERNLPMDLHTGDFVGPGGRDFRLRSLGSDWILERFPEDAATALNAD